MQDFGPRFLGKKIELAESSPVSMLILDIIEATFRLGRFAANLLMNVNVLFPCQPLCHL